MAFISRVHIKIAKKAPFYCLFLILSIIFIQRWKKSTVDTSSREEMTMRNNAGGSTAKTPHKNARRVAKRFPGALIIGVMKGGTTALNRFLSLNPLIRKAPYEIHFFNKDEEYNKGLEYYKNKMPLSFPRQITIERTPGYFRTPSVPERVFRFNNSIKLILIVRDPSTRLISEYTHRVASGRNETNYTLEEIALNTDGTVNTDYLPIRKGLYHEHYTRWMKFFQKEQLFVIHGEAFRNDPYPILKKAEKFLNVPSYIRRNHIFWNSTKQFYCPLFVGNFARCLTEEKGRTHPKVSERILGIIRDFYRPHNRIFEKMLNYSFQWP